MAKEANVIIKLVDQMMKEFSGQTLVDSSRVIDGLLDIRGEAMSLAPTTVDDFPDSTPTLEAVGVPST